MSSFSIFSRSISALCAMGLLSGCGTYVPGLEEPGQNPLDTQDWVHEVVKHIHCEVQRAVQEVYLQDEKFMARYNNGVSTVKWLDDWGAQITLNLTVEETSGLNPGVSFVTPIIPGSVNFPGNNNVYTAPQFYKFGLGGQLSADATRIDKLSTYYTIRELRTEPSLCDTQPSTYLLLEGDLKIKEWLVDTIFLQGTGAAEFNSKEVRGQFKQDVISHEVKFIVTTNGNATPSWNRIRISTVDSNLLNAGRVRTHDLTVTFGPNETSPPGPAGAKTKERGRRPVNNPSLAAANAHLASQIGLAVANSLKTLGQ